MINFPKKILAVPLVTVFTVMMIVFAMLLGLASSAHAYFEFDHDLLWGEVTKTTLPDGRVRHVTKRFDNVKIPDSIRASIEGDTPMEYNADTMHFSGYYDITIDPSIKPFKIEEHSDTSRIACHESGDMNMRLSLFSISDDLKKAIDENDKNPVVLHSVASKHQCHGQPIFRKINSAHFVEGSDEVLLVTSKAKYEEIMSDLDIEFHVEHPLLTHIETGSPAKIFDKNAIDHGVNWNAEPTTQGAILIRRSPNLVYQREQADNDVGGMFSKKTGSAYYPVNQESSKKAQQQGRDGKTQGLFDKIKKACKKVAAVVKTTATKAASTVTNVAQAAGKGIVAAANAVKNALSINLNVDESLSKSISTCDVGIIASKLCNKPLGGVLFTFEMTFTATLHFKWIIATNKLTFFYSTLTGAITAGAGAKTQNYQDGDGQVVLIELPGPKISFVVPPGIPVWIDVKVNLLGGISVTYGTHSAFAAGYNIGASATIGVQWTAAAGFTMLTSKEFTHGYNLDYPKSSPVNIQVAPYIGVQPRFALYSIATGYPSITFGLDNDIQIDTNDPDCQLSLYSKFFIRLSAGLDFEISIASITIFFKGFGPWELWSTEFPIFNWCLKTLPWLSQAASASSSSLALAHRNALALANSATIKLGPKNNGKIWQTNFTCPGALSNVEYDFQVTGFFGDSDTPFTFFFVRLSRNITNADGSFYSLVRQSLLTYLDSNPTLGLQSSAEIVALSQDIADALNMTFDQLSELYTGNSGNPNISSIPITYLNVSFSANDLDQANFYNPGLCSNIGIQEKGASSAATPQPQGSFAARLMARIVPQTADSFMTLITGTLVAVLIIAVIEIVIVILLPKIIGTKFFPKRKEDPRYRENVIGVAALVVGVLCYITFVIGGSVTFAQIVGARVDPNYVPPPPGAPIGQILTASGVEVSLYEFQGTDIKVSKCPQYYPCSPNCRDLCSSRHAKWIGVVWPYCSSNAIMTDEGGCTMFAWDAVLNASLSIIFLIIGCALPLLKFSNIYRRMPLSNAFFLLSGMCLALLEKRVVSFMTEVRMNLFDPAIGMIIPYDLQMNTLSLRCFSGAVAAFWVLCGIQALVTIHELLDYYKQTKEGKIVFLEEDFMNDLDSQQAKDEAKKNGTDRASVAGFESEMRSTAGFPTGDAPLDI